MKYYRNQQMLKHNILLLVAIFLIGWHVGSTMCRGGEWSCPLTIQTVDQKWLAPLEHSPKRRNFSVTLGEPLSLTTDTFTPFHRYMMEFSNPSPHEQNFTELPQFDTWVHYFEAYHNHMSRFRNKKHVVFMEIGVQSGGKIPLLRKYFGPGLTYVGIDINPSTKMFETKEKDDFTVHVEIGDTENVTFLEEIKLKYPHVDIFLDDGGHKMTQQITAMKHMLPHVQPEGIYMCEDLATSWLKKWGGVTDGFIGGDRAFLEDTMVGFIHKTLDWLLASSLGTKDVHVQPNLDDLPDDLFQVSDNNNDTWWRMIPSQVKHIHYYNQIVVYEKGATHRPSGWRTIGNKIPYRDSGKRPPVDWKLIIQKLDAILGESRL